MAREVKINTPSRLHFGMINPFIRGARRYISAGVAVSYPNNVVIVKEGSELRVEGCRSDEVFTRIKDFAIKHGLKGIIEIRECIPRHIGLGSTTQLVLAAGYGLALVNNRLIDPVEIAVETGLGKYSGVGTYVFKYGGFVVDMGRSESTVFPPLLTRLEFPEEWVFIIAIPSGSGLDEEREDRIFAEENWNIPVELTWKASYHLIELSSAVAERDFDSFVKALTALQENVGSMFSRYQGGVFSVNSARAIELLRENGVEGVGQSSWGPAVYGVVNGLEEAEAILEKLRPRLDGKVFITSPRNKGAEVMEEK